MISLPKPLKCWDHCQAPSDQLPILLRLMLLHVRLYHIWVSVHLLMDIWVVSALGCGCMCVCICLLLDICILLYVYMYVCMHACMCESLVILFFVTYSVPSFWRHSILLFIVFVLFTVPAVHSDPSFKALLVSPVLSHSLCFL